jgi:Flp pilus assembly protein TadG
MRFLKSTPGSGTSVPLSRRRRGFAFRRGTEVLELALLLPILLVLIFGAVEAAYFFFVQHVVEGAAREGARVAVLYWATEADARARIDNVMRNSGLPKNVAYDIGFNSADPEAVTVSVSCNWNQFQRIALLHFITTGKVSGHATMRKEGTP